MRSRQSQVIQAVTGALGFLTKYKDQLPNTNASGARQQLDALNTQFLADAGTQQGKTQALQGVVTEKSALRTTLFTDHLIPIVAAARLVGTTVPALQKVVLPKDTLSIPRLAAAARGIGESTQPYATQLIAVGLAPDFTDSLNTAVTTLEGAMATTIGHRGSRVNATKALSGHEQSVGKVLRLLRGLVRSELGKSDPAAMAEWNSMTNISSRTATPAATTPTTTTPAATSAPATPAPATSAPATSAPATPAPATPAPATPAPATPAPTTPAPAASPVSVAASTAEKEVTATSA